MGKPQSSQNRAKEGLVRLGGEQEQSLLESGVPSCCPARGPGMQSRMQRAMPTPCARGIGRNRGMDAAEQHAAPTNSPPAGGTSPRASATAPLPSVPAPGGGPHTPSPPWHGSNHAQEPPAPWHSLRGGRGPCKEVPEGLRLPLAPWRGFGGGSRGWPAQSLPTALGSEASRAGFSRLVAHFRRTIM